MFLFFPPVKKNTPRAPPDGSDRSDQVPSGLGGQQVGALQGGVPPEALPGVSRDERLATRDERLATWSGGEWIFRSASWGGAVKEEITSLVSCIPTRF